MKYAALALLLLAASCSSKPSSQDGKLTVVANFYPVAEAAQRVGGNRVSVTNLTPAGVEPHDLELTSRDIDRIEGADVLLYVGSGFQPAVAKAAQRRDKPSRDVGVDLRPNDPHFWLDPDLMAKSVDRVESAFVHARPANAHRFRANADAYKRELATLDGDYRGGLANCARHEIVTAHAAFAYLATGYGLTQVPIAGVSPDAEVDPRRLAQLTDLIKRDHVTTVFYEELVPRDFADSLAQEAGVTTAVLNPIEGLTRKELAAGGDYVSVMRSNLASLVAALGCA